MGRSRLLPLLVILAGALLSIGGSCTFYDDDDYYFDDDDCYWVDDQLICVYDDDHYLTGKFRPLPPAEAGVLLKGAADARFSRVSITVTRIELLGEKTEIIYDDPNGLEIDLCEGAEENNVYDRILARASVAPGSCRAIRMTYHSATCVPAAGTAVGGPMGPERIEQAADGEVVVDIDTPVPMGPGERCFFIVTFDLAATLTRQTTTAPTTPVTGGAAMSESAPRPTTGSWVMWPRGEARLYRPTDALIRR
jgi:hypothetical protein